MNAIQYTYYIQANTMKKQTLERFVPHCHLERTRPWCHNPCRSSITNVTTAMDVNNRGGHRKVSHNERVFAQSSSLPTITTNTMKVDRLLLVRVKTTHDVTGCCELA